MVFLQVDLSERENRVLELYQVYTGSSTKVLALKRLLDEFDLSMVREEFEEKQK